MTPFLKWAGGKRWLVGQPLGIFPKDIRTYFEPFLGSGAVFFHLCPKSAVLADVNQELIDTYLAIKTNWSEVFARLKRHHKFHSKTYYYEVRESAPKERYDQAARFIYLNRTCWNGLYRVNLQGKFNVPVGTKSNVLLPSDDFEKVSNLLQGVDLLCSDFESVIDQAGEGDFVYIDPPYTINHESNGFIKYNKVLFSWSDQERLSRVASRSIDRGAMILISNACHPTIQSLYDDRFEIHELSRSSIISGKPSGRRRGKEMLIIGGYKWV